MIRRSNIDFLLDEADQMDFYTAFLFAEKGAVFELFEIEIGVQLAVDTQQHIPLNASVRLSASL